MARGLVKAAAYSAAGALVVLLVVFGLYLKSRPELAVWHLADLDEEFTAASEVETFADYLDLEDRLFAQLNHEVYARTPTGEHRLINRYSRGSLSDPERWSPNWNRSFELPAPNPRAGVLLLHGMSDSPYSLRALGQSLNAAGAVVVGLRVPGHGTAPSGLVEVTWQDMAAAVRLAMLHLAHEARGRPLYIVGYSNGAALGVHYALQTLEDASLPKVAGLSAALAGHWCLPGGGPRRLAGPHRPPARPRPTRLDGDPAGVRPLQVRLLRRQRRRPGVSPDRGDPGGPRRPGPGRPARRVPAGAGLLLRCGRHGLDPGLGAGPVRAASRGRSRTRPVRHQPRGSHRAHLDL